jgi:phytanoyl-CoA hydroxylase
MGRFPYRDEDAVAVEVAAGSVVLFNSYLLHRSLPNTGRHGCAARWSTTT